MNKIKKNNNKLILWIGFIPVISIIVTAFFIANIFITQIKSNNKIAIEELKEKSYVMMKNKAKERVHRVIKRLDNIAAKDKAKIFLNQSSFGDKGYFFAYTYDGITISHVKKSLLGLNRWDLKKDGRYILQDLINKGRNKDGGFMEYTATVDPVTNMSAKKISYVHHYDRFGWIIGTGIYTTSINNEIFKQKNDFKKASSDMIRSTIQYVIIITLVIIAIILLINQKLLNIFSDYESRLLKKDKILQEQAKLAAMGEMIGSIAHQWRQPLNALSLNIQSLDDDYEDGLVDEKFINNFITTNKNTINFMSNTIDDFRNFFRIDKEKKLFNVKESINSVLNIQQSQFKDYKISLNIQGETFHINGYESEFKQVILNIINNAKEALIENNKEIRVIDIKLTNNSVCIKDNAGGIPKNIINRVFEPYFTTKEQGKGTGIGLYMSKMIIEDNISGKLTVKNDSDGAIFKIEFNKQGML